MCSKTAVMGVIIFILSLDSSTVQHRGTLGNRRACTFSDAGFIVKLATALEECITED
jgi:hypothetical protein